MLIISAQIERVSMEKTRRESVNDHVSVEHILIPSEIMVWDKQHSCRTNSVELQLC